MNAQETVSNIFSDEERYVLVLIAGLIYNKSDRAQEIGVSIKYLNRNIKNDSEISGKPLSTDTRVKLHRIRKSLEKKKMIETYHMNKDQMVSEGNATHIVLTGNAHVFLPIMLSVTDDDNVTEKSENAVTNSENVT